MSMRANTTIAGACVLAVFLVGCGGGEDPVSVDTPDDVLVGTAAFESRVGGRVVADSLAITLGYTAGDGSSQLEAIEIGAQDSVVTYTYTRDGSPSFDAFALRLTNSVDDLLEWRFFCNGSPWDGGVGPESIVLIDRIDGESGADLSGHAITRIEAATDVLSIQVPGSDPNGDGIWTDQHIVIRYSFYAEVADGGETF